ncbi:beta-lactamase [Yoonia sediminilitoris]|uniref:Beta-lactamase n=2 Tax=Yoonia sediminilitoris TaxID=1286148 RepID=A0A2T6KG44_9RHOB|nr:beta-lactamase [Yoonia sediminilitoris]RCW95223.1 beta-lactamase [Yoonia sediminilitoris]
MSACVTETADVRFLNDPTRKAATQTVSEGPTYFDAPPPYGRWGVGFQLSSEQLTFPTDRSFAHGGAGGRLSFVDPEHEIGIAFLTNQMLGPEDRRTDMIIGALAEALRWGPDPSLSVVCYVAPVSPRQPPSPRLLTGRCMASEPCGLTTFASKPAPSLLIVSNS